MLQTSSSQSQGLWLVGPAIDVGFLGDLKSDCCCESIDFGPKSRLSLEMVECNDLIQCPWLSSFARGLLLQKKAVLFISQWLSDWHSENPKFQSGILASRHESSMDEERSVRLTFIPRIQSSNRILASRHESAMDKQRSATVCEKWQHCTVATWPASVTLSVRKKMNDCLAAMSVVCRLGVCQL